MVCLGSSGSLKRWLGRLFLAAAMLCHAAAAAAELFPAPTWTTYAFSEALFMGRDNQAANQPLIVETGAPENVLVSAQSLQFPFSEGVRAFYGARSPERYGWEMGYFGLYGQSASAEAGLPPGEYRYLQAPEPLGGLLTSGGEVAFVTWNSVINGAELNLFSTSTDWNDRHAGWRTLDWIVGFRYVGVEENSMIGIKTCNCEGPFIPYGVQTSSNLFGAQVGSRGRLDRGRWAFEGWAKAGIMGAFLQQRQDAIVDWLGETQRPASSSTGTETGFIGDLNVSTIYRLTDVWGIRAGYNTIWISGAALTPNQYSFGLDGPVQTVAGGGGIFLHGANLGLEARW